MVTILSRRNLVFTISKIQLLLTVLAVFTLGCSSIITPSVQPSPTPTQYIPSTDALVTFRVTIPTPLEPGDSLYLATLDEVTGLDNDPKLFIMEAEDDTHYYVILPLPLDTLIQYRYQRQGQLIAQEFLPDNRPVRYRLFHVDGPGIINDVISRWSDTNYSGATGKLTGKVTDFATGAPVPSIMVTVAGYQVFTHADGSFNIGLVPPGTHNLVVISTNGSYLTFQQGAFIQSDLTTHAEITLHQTVIVTGTFIVKLPDNTPDQMPVRFAGNLLQLGNSFSDFSGGTSSVLLRMPTLQKQLDGTHSVTLQLPSKTSLKYKYSLGDGFWNAERSTIGEFVQRQIIVPDHDFQVHDVVDGWNDGTRESINFQTTAPKSSLEKSLVYIQFDPGFGWTEPLPMWRSNVIDTPVVWNFSLFSPIDKLTTLKYRYCFAGLCNEAYALDQSGTSSQEFMIDLSQKQSSFTDQVYSWAGHPGLTSEPAIIPNVSIIPRANGFVAGVAIDSRYHPSWGSILPQTISDINNLSANWIYIQPTWSYTTYSPPTLEYSHSENPGWNDLLQWINHAHMLQLNVAINPIPLFPKSQIIPEDNLYLYPEQWNIWFENYSSMMKHFALLATQSSAESIVIGDYWIPPELRDQPNLNEQFDNNWIELISSLRSIFPGRIVWATNYSESIQRQSSFIDLVDDFYIIWSLPAEEILEITSRDMRDDVSVLIDRDIRPLWKQYKKPIILALDIPSPTMVGQVNAYNGLMMALNERKWLGGIVSSGYHSLLPMQDSSSSVHGKSASGVLWYWFPLLLGD